MLRQEANGHPRTTALPWPFPPGVLPLVCLWIAWSWWKEILAQVQAAASAGEAVDPHTMAALTLGARALGALSESAFYVLWRKSSEACLPYWRFTYWVASLSAADLLGFALRRVVGEAPGFLRISCAVLTGPAALDPAPVADPGVMAAFGGLGVLTLLRVGMTAWAQARGIGRSLGGPLLLTTSAWLLTRLAGWWSLDLMKGLSPVR